jgi:hypothetical protein
MLPMPAQQRLTTPTALNSQAQTWPPMARRGDSSQVLHKSQCTAACCKLRRRRRPCTESDRCGVSAGVAGQTGGLAGRGGTSGGSR